MYKFYPYINSQEDLVAVVESEYQTQTGDALPPLFLKKLIDARRTTIVRAMGDGRTIKFDRLGKLKVTNAAKDKKAIKEHLGEGCTAKEIKAEAKLRHAKGELLSQRYSKSTNTPKKHFKFSISKTSKG